jgi:drug/metabolite transporter (DMT)-like permease
MHWIVFVFGTILTWGVYGVLLHSGQMAMGDPVNGRYKAFLFVGIAYFVIGIIAPLIMMFVNNSSFDFTPKGMSYSFIAGVVGALGAFFVLLAFGAKGTPSVVMSLVFAGAPIVNAVVAISIHPTISGLKSLNWQFVAGILLAALGGYLVTMYRPS